MKYLIYGMEGLFYLIICIIKAQNDLNCSDLLIVPLSGKFIKKGSYLLVFLTISLTVYFRNEIFNN